MSITYDLGLRDDREPEEEKSMSEHAPRPLEYCFMCDEPTGRAGQSEDSFYCACDKGPFCEGCWDDHHNADTKVANLLEALVCAQQVVNMTDVERWWIDVAMKAITKAKTKQ